MTPPLAASQTTIHPGSPDASALPCLAPGESLSLSAHLN
jgi:hypothetical protein